MGSVKRTRPWCLVLAWAIASLAAAGCHSPTAVEPVSLGFGEERDLGTHREVDVGFRSVDGAVLAGTLYLPPGPGPHPAIVFHYGSGPWTRSLYTNSGIPEWIGHGIAVLSYDKRGNGKSQGDCCPWQEPDYFPLLGQDVLAGLRAIAAHPDVDPHRVGLFGFSQGGWILPVAAAEGGTEVAFTIIGSGPAVTLGEELLYSSLTGEDNRCQPSGLSAAEIEARMQMSPPSGFDPAPYLETMTAPGLWIYGDLDLSVPVNRSVGNLERIRQEKGKDWTVIVLPNVNHDWVIGGALCQGSGPRISNSWMFDWLLPRLAAGAA